MTETTLNELKPPNESIAIMLESLIADSTFQSPGIYSTICQLIAMTEITQGHARILECLEKIKTMYGKSKDHGRWILRAIDSVKKQEEEANQIVLATIESSGHSGAEEQTAGA